MRLGLMAGIVTWRPDDYRAPRQPFLSFASRVTAKDSAADRIVSLHCLTNQVTRPGSA
jgi:hypothetical protein